MKCCLPRMPNDEWEVDVARLAKIVDWDRGPTIGPLIASGMVVEYQSLYQEVLSDPDLARLHWNQGWTLLHHAVSDDHEEMAQLLLRSGADVNANSHAEGTPLHLLRDSRSLTMAKLLIENSADVTLLDRTQSLPIHWAVVVRCLELVELFLVHGSPVNHRNLAGQSPLDLAAIKQYREIVKLLIAHGATSKTPRTVKYLVELTREND